MKVVINRCFGGFGISAKAEQIIYELGYYGDIYKLPRHDQRLIKAIELLGNEANGDYAELTIIDIEPPYLIDNYDGLETIITKHFYEESLKNLIENGIYEKE